MRTDNLCLQFYQQGNKNLFEKKVQFRYSKENAENLATKISSEGVNLDKQAFNASLKTIAAQKAAGQNLSPAEVWYSGNQPGATTKYPSFCSSFTIRLARLRSLCFLRISKQSSLYGEPVFNIV